MTATATAKATARTSARHDGVSWSGTWTWTSGHRELWSAIEGSGTCRGCWWIGCGCFVPGRLHPKRSALIPSGKRMQERESAMENVTASVTVMVAAKARLMDLPCLFPPWSEE